MSGRAGGYSVTISAVDAASKQIDAINKRLAAMNAPVQRVQQSLTKFADVSGLSKLGAGLNNVYQSAYKAFLAIGKIIEPLAAITGAVSIAGVYKLVTSFADFGRQLGFSAQRIGITAQQLQGLQGAARLAGTSSEALTSGMATLQDNLTDMVAGRAPAETIGLMNQLGIAFKDTVTGGARKAIDVLPQLADVIKNLKNPALQLRVATMAFGGAAEQMLPFLRRGAQGIAEYNALAAKYGVTSEAGIKAANDLAEAQTKVSLAVEGLRNSIGEKLAPILTPLLTQLADWIGLNREWISTNIADAVQKLSDYLKQIDWAAIGKGIKDFAVEADHVAIAFGGWKPLLEDIAAFIAGSWLLRVSTPLLSVLRLLALIPGSGVAAAMLGAGAAAGAMQVPMTDEFGRVTGNWGGRDESNNPAAGPAVANEAAQPDHSVTSWIKNKVGGWFGGGGGGGQLNAGEAARQKEAWDYWTHEGGKTPQQAAGLVAREQLESRFDYTDKTGDSGQAHGSFQWHADRRANILAGTGIDIDNSTHLQQLRAMNWEMTQGAERGNAARFNQATTPFEAGKDFSQDIIRPGDREGQGQATGQLAEDIYKKFNVPQAAPPVAPVAAGAPAAAPVAPVAAGAPANIGDGSGSGDAANGVQTIKGSANVNINLRGAPPGTTTTATSDGIFGPPPRISTSMPAYGS